MNSSFRLLLALLVGASAGIAGVHAFNSSTSAPTVASRPAYSDAPRELLMELSEIGTRLQGIEDQLILLRSLRASSDTAADEPPIATRRSATSASRDGTSVAELDDEVTRLLESLRSLQREAAASSDSIYAQISSTPGPNWEEIKRFIIGCNEDGWKERASSEIHMMSRREVLSRFGTPTIFKSINMWAWCFDDGAEGPFLIIEFQEGLACGVSACND